MKDKREQIAYTALHLFAEKGFEGTSIRDIAEKASVNVAMVNYYFGSKEKLYEQIVDIKFAATRGLLDEINNDQSLSCIQKVDKIIDSYIERLFSHRIFHRLIHQELIINQRENLQVVIIDNLLYNSKTIKGIIESGIKNGDFKKVDVELTIASLVGTINQILLSKKFCNKLMNKPCDYVPYDDPKFKKRVSNHLKQMMRDYLLNN